MPELPEDLIDAYLDKVLPDPYSLTSCEKMSAKVAEQLGVIVSPEEMIRLNAQKSFPFRDAYMEELRATREEMRIHLCARASEYEVAGKSPTDAVDSAIERFGNPSVLALRLRTAIALHALPKIVSPIFFARSFARSATVRRVSMMWFVFFTTFVALWLNHQYLMYEASSGHEVLMYTANVCTAMTITIPALYVKLIHDIDRYGLYANMKPIGVLSQQQRINRASHNFVPYLFWFMPYIVVQGDWADWQAATARQIPGEVTFMLSNLECSIAGVVIAILLWCSLGRTKNETA